jgi:DNA-directed RNA polymerase specialized sigma24 family protein
MDMNELTDKQRQVMLMPYTCGWRLERMGQELGISRQSAGRLLQRAHLRLGFPRLARAWKRRRKPRRCKAVQLSVVGE